MMEDNIFGNVADEMILLYDLFNSSSINLHSILTVCLGLLDILQSTRDTTGSWMTRHLQSDHLIKDLAVFAKSLDIILTTRKYERILSKVMVSSNLYFRNLLWIQHKEYIMSFLRLGKLCTYPRNKYWLNKAVAFIIKKNGQIWFWIWEWLRF